MFGKKTPALLCLVSVLTLGGPLGANAAKPPGGGGGDTTPPANVSPLTISASLFALVLRFTAPGDDGTSGTASGYDVYYRESESACSDVPNDTSWTRANRSDSTAPQAAGRAEAFPVRPLDANTSYCVAIRAKDERPNYSDWARATAFTGDGDDVASDDFGLTQLEMPSSMVNPSRAVMPGGVIAGPAGPVMGWSLLISGGQLQPEVVFTDSIWRKELSVTNLISQPNTFNVAAVPESIAGPIAGVMAGLTSGGSARYVLIEGAGPGNDPVATTIASGGTLDNGPDSALTYVPNGNGGWNPVVALDRVVAKSKTFKKSTLMVAERIGGTWVEEPVFSRELTAANNSPSLMYGFFSDVELIAKPNGSLGVLAVHCGVAVYAQRDPQTSTWTYYDAGPAPDRVDNRTRMALDDAGEVIVVSARYYPASDGGDRLLVGRERDFVPMSSAPPSACPIVGVAPRTEISIPDAVHPDWGQLDIAALGAATFITGRRFDLVTGDVQHSLVYSCGGSDGWHEQRIDATFSGQFRSPVLDGSGNRLSAYAWGILRPIGTQLDKVYLVSDGGNPCM